MIDPAPVNRASQAGGPLHPPHGHFIGYLASLGLRGNTPFSEINDALPGPLV